MKKLYLVLFALLVVGLAGSAIAFVEATAPTEAPTVVADQGSCDTGLTPVDPRPEPLFPTVLDNLDTAILCSGQYCTSSSQCESVPGWKKVCRWNDCCYYQ